jgi:small subunit ribosomal protein S4
MKVGPKYKIAKRLGAPVFEKTQTQKFALSEARKTKVTRKRGGAASDYSKQLTEKQKMRYTYGITEKQLRRYVDEAMAKGHQPIALLIGRLESRLDNVVYRLGLASTRYAARQMVSHGHILVNGRKLTIPSYKVRVNDKISVREGSKGSGLFMSFEEKHAGAVPQWLTFDVKAMSGEMKAEPTYEPTEVLFDPVLVLEYYSR